MPGDILLIYNSRSENAFTALICIFFTVIFLAMIVASFISDAIPFSTKMVLGDSGMALAALLFGYGTLVHIRRMRDREPIIILNNEGISSRESPYSLIPWSAIASVDATQVGRGPEMLMLSLHSPENWFRCLPKYAQHIKALTKSSTIRIEFYNTTPSAYQAAAFVKNHITTQDKPR